MGWPDNRPTDQCWGAPGAGFGGPALCDKLLRRLTPRHVCVCAHTGAQGSFRNVCSGRPNRCSPRGGTCPPEPCFGFYKVPGCPIPTHRGKRGLKERRRSGPFCGEGLTSRSLSLAHLEVHIRSASPGQWPEVSGRVEPSFPWPHSQELSSCGTLSPSQWGQVTWPGDPSPSLGVQ